MSQGQLWQHAQGPILERFRTWNSQPRSDCTDMNYARSIGDIIEHELKSFNQMGHDSPVRFDIAFPLSPTLVQPVSPCVESHLPQSMVLILSPEETAEMHRSIADGYQMAQMAIKNFQSYYESRDDADEEEEEDEEKETAEDEFNPTSKLRYLEHLQEQGTLKFQRPAKLPMTKSRKQPQPPKKKQRKRRKEPKEPKKEPKQTKRQLEPSFIAPSQRHPPLLVKPPLSMHMVMMAARNASMAPLKPMNSSVTIKKEDPDIDRMINSLSSIDPRTLSDVQLTASGL